MGATGGIIFRINECIADVPPEKMVDDWTR